MRVYNLYLHFNISKLCAKFKESGVSQNLRWSLRHFIKHNIEYPHGIRKERFSFAFFRVRW